ncbi:hypothetical protein B0T20DRAFT_35548 [Sordaria brevicollis]|uniref:Extracellular membrane protein CFEM domain-containing protein n=1 Tax=Sordaria brevicollis TaxID=83679 RepID=A0AAE0P8W3_SORBR|nr:hypothetical protein B0T20DRAFT_35548 [Sordaria brevicollis]
MSSKITLAFITGLSLTTFANAEVPISIFSYTPYLQQRECVKDCIWHSGSTATDLIIALGCSGPWVNECYCSGDDNYEHARTASSFLRGCVADSCRTPPSNTLVTSAFGVYNDYCAEAGMDIPLVVASTTSSEPEMSIKESKSGSKGEPTASVESGDGPSSTDTGLSTGAKIGLAVGSTAGALALAISAVITWRLKVKARMSLPRRKDTEVKDNDTGRTEAPRLQLIRHSGLPSASTRYN